MIIPKLNATQWRSHRDIPALPNLRTLYLLNSGTEVGTLARILFVMLDLPSLEYNFAQDLESP